jgi:hypothetical protein
MTLNILFSFPLNIPVWFLFFIKAFAIQNFKIAYAIKVLKPFHHRLSSKFFMSNHLTFNMHIALMLPDHFVPCDVTMPSSKLPFRKLRVKRIFQGAHFYPAKHKTQV